VCTRQLHDKVTRAGKRCYCSDDDLPRVKLWVAPSIAGSCFQSIGTHWLALRASTVITTCHRGNSNAGDDTCYVRGLNPESCYTSMSEGQSVSERTRGLQRRVFDNIGPE